MASKVPKASGGVAVKHLIVDSSPLLTAPLSSLRGIATNYLVTPDVVMELRDKNGRNVLDEANLQLPADTTVSPSHHGANDDDDNDDEMKRTHEGFQVREPTAESIAKITAFARKTGDIAVLSAADIRVLALCLTLELEENGTWRVRDHPGQVLSGPPPAATSAAASATPAPQKGGDDKEEDKEEGEVERVGTVDAVTDKLAKLDVEGGEAPSAVKEAAAATEEEANAPAATSSSSEATPPGAASTSVSSEPAPVPSTSSAAVASSSGGETNAKDGREDEEAQHGEEDSDDDDEDGNESDESSGSWITPANIHEHKVKDLGLFSAPSTSATTSTSKAATTKPKTILKAAVLTGDFAMQNVGLQMGLNVLGSGGKRVKEVRTWVLRCHACFKLCKNPEKRFCPSCGGATLLRTSITYVPSTPQNPQGYILHLKQNYNYRLRGTQYSLPTPQMGKAGGLGKKAAPVLREDQKEWIKGVKSNEVRQQKEQRALVKAVLDEEKKGKGKARANGPGGGGTSSTGFFQGAGGAYGLESAMLGMAGPKGGIEHQKGRRRGGKNGAGGETRLDSSGLPVIGMGRKNPNESRRRR
ncbi:hypothetical protein JCM3766R1_007062 [Sporobolomyces carnicolor]